MLIASNHTIREAENHLITNDPALAPVIHARGPCTLRPHRNYYKELVESIIGQQLSLKAAAAIEARLIAYYGGEFPSPDQIRKTDIETMRGIGLSRPKAAYMHSLADHLLDGHIVLDTFDALPNDEIIRELTAVKGIGEWTVHMFLIFCMGRLDVLPVGDLGIKNGIRNLYDIPSPTVDDIRHIAVQFNWHPYESVASWYVWRSLEPA